MEAEPAAPPEVPPSLEHDVVIEEDEHTKYPAALASHEGVLEDKQLFLGLLQDLCTKLQDAEPKKFRPTKFRVPTGARWLLPGSQEVLHRQVLQRGWHCHGLIAGRLCGPVSQS